MSSFPRPTMLMILDGYGINPDKHGNSIAMSHKPYLNKLFTTYPNTKIKASGLAVGLPEGQMGNSEVGHLNIGAGRIVYQELTKISKSIEDGDFEENKAINNAMAHAVNNNSSLHLMGLLSDGGVHSHISHLKALLDLAAKKHIKKVFVHCFLDGRDVPPRCAKTYISDLQKHMEKLNTGTIGVISGRYYAMDRDKRWDRLEKAYNALVLSEGIFAKDALSAIDMAYERNENDEFVLPTILENTHCQINDNDAIIMYNFRPDRARELTRAFVTPSFDGFIRKKVIKNLFYMCMTQYDATINEVEVAFPPQTLSNTLGEYIASLDLNQLRIAETEKYAHVTFFFNGGFEAPSRNEDRILIPSPKVATYDLQPEMSANEVSDAVTDQIKSDKYDLIILNFANADMVGHTGKIDAAIKAIETLNTVIPQIVEAVLEKDGQILLTADHGNADYMLDENDNIVTAHSLNEVPLMHISNSPKELKSNGKLADIAPTLLELMNLPIPKEMTGESLLKR